MAMMQIDLPDALQTFIESEAERSGFGSTGEYVQSLIHDAQRRRDPRASIEAQLIEGLDSGEATPMTSGDWERIRREVRRSGS